MILNRPKRKLQVTKVWLRRSKRSLVSEAVRVTTTPHKLPRVLTITQHKKSQKKSQYQAPNPNIQDQDQEVTIIPNNQDIAPEKNMITFK